MLWDRRKLYRAGVCEVMKISTLRARRMSRARIWITDLDAAGAKDARRGSGLLLDLARRFGEHVTDGMYSKAGTKKEIVTAVDFDAASPYSS